MEDLAVIAIASLLATLGFVLGQKLQPKNQTWGKLRKEYEEIIDGQIKQIKQLRSTANWFKRGQVPRELANADGTDALIEGIFQALPSNFRDIASSFKPAIKDYVKNNPEVVDTVKNVISQKLASVGGKGQQQLEQIDSL